VLKVTGVRSDSHPAVRPAEAVAFDTSESGFETHKEIR